MSRAGMATPDRKVLAEALSAITGLSATTERQSSCLEKGGSDPVTYAGGTQQSWGLARTRQEARIISAGVGTE